MLHIKSADVLTSLLNEMICALPTMTCASVRKTPFDLNVSIIITDASKRMLLQAFSQTSQMLYRRPGTSDVCIAE